MIENTRSIDRAAAVILLIGLAFILFPLVLVVITATRDYGDFVSVGFSLMPGDALGQNLADVWQLTSLPLETWNSIVTAALSAFGRVSLAFTTAFAVVFFAARYRPLIYAAVLASIMLPLELMVITAYQVTSNVALPINAVANAGGVWAAIFGSPLDLELNLLGTYGGVAIPLMAQGTATLILVQFFRTLPPDLAKAAMMDGAGPWRFMVDILLPLSKGPMLALGIYMFISGWVAYLWPLMVTTGAPDRRTAVVGLTRLTEGTEDAIPNFPLEMAGAIVVTLTPLILIALFQRQIVRGLTLSEK